MKKLFISIVFVSLLLCSCTSTIEYADKVNKFIKSSDNYDLSYTGFQNNKDVDYKISGNIVFNDYSITLLEGEATLKTVSCPFKNYYKVVNVITVQIKNESATIKTISYPLFNEGVEIYPGEYLEDEVVIDCKNGYEIDTLYLISINGKTVYDHNKKQLTITNQTDSMTRVCNVIFNDNKDIVSYSEAGSSLYSIYRPYSFYNLLIVKK